MIDIACSCEVHFINPTTLDWFFALLLRMINRTNDTFDGFVGFVGMVVCR